MVPLVVHTHITLIYTPRLKYISVYSLCMSRSTSMSQGLIVK